MGRRTRARAALAACLALAAPVVSTASPSLVDPAAGTLELVTPGLAEQAKLDRIDGLAFDAFGNLFGVLEIPGPRGAVVFVDKHTGRVTSLVSGISRADQVALHPSGDLLVTSEIRPPSTRDRLFRVRLQYGAGDVPVAATRSSVATSLAIDNPEGLAVLFAPGAFGASGDAFVAEDRSPGRIFRVDPGTGTASVLVGGLRRPEGLAFGDFGGRAAEALFAAVTLDDSVVRIDATGAAAAFGAPASVALTRPDNVEFGPDGFLYVSEDRPAPSSRIVRVAADGTHAVFAEGFGQAAGLAFDPITGDLYIAEQDLDRIWRVRFAPAPAEVDEIRLEGEVAEIVWDRGPAPFALPIEEGEIELRASDLARDPGGDPRRLRVEIEAEVEGGIRIELACDAFRSFSYERDLHVRGAECVLSSKTPAGRTDTDACARLVVRPASGSYEALVEPRACAVAIGRETLRISGPLERFRVSYRE